MISSEDRIAYPFSFITSYNQFYITDGSDNIDTGGDFWDEDAFESHLPVSKGVIGVGTESYGHIKGQLEILKKKPKDTLFENYNHVVEAGIDLDSGVLQILNCPSSIVQLDLKISKGSYRMRVCSSGLTGIQSDDEDEQHKDYYKIQIWPDTLKTRVVLKQFQH